MNVLMIMIYFSHKMHDFFVVLKVLL